jgi:FMN phosphatase YigB (HAD superfamily)
MAKAVLLDLNGVVEDLRDFYWHRDDLVAEALKPRFVDSRVREEAAAVRDSYSHIMAHSTPEFHLMFWEDLLRRLDPSVTPGQLFDAYNAFVELYVKHSAVYADAAALLGNPPPSCVLGLLSNANSVRARRFLAHHGLTDRFASVVISHDTPYAKPSREVFLLAAQRMGLPADQIVMIGDRLDNDIFGAQQAGMIPVLLDRSGKLTDEKVECKVIETLSQFSEVLENPWPVELLPEVRPPVVVIVCGGRGSRLREKLGSSQKCLAPVNGKPILLHTIDALVSAGLREFDLLAGASAPDIQAVIDRYDGNPNGRFRILPIDEPGTGRAFQSYWRDSRPAGQSIVYSHGNIILGKEVVRQFLRFAESQRHFDTVFLASPTWVAQTHAALFPVMGKIQSITTGTGGSDRSGLCSVGLAFIRSSVPLSEPTIPDAGMFEEIVESLRATNRAAVGYLYTDAVWEHLGVPKDWARLVEATGDHS